MDRYHGWRFPASPETMTSCTKALQREINDLYIPRRNFSATIENIHKQQFRGFFQTWCFKLFSSTATKRPWNALPTYWIYDKERVFSFSPFSFVIRPRNTSAREWPWSQTLHVILVLKIKQHYFSWPSGPLYLKSKIRISYKLN